MYENMIYPVPCRGCMPHPFLPPPCPRPIPECRGCGCGKPNKFCPQEVTIRVLGVDNCGNLQLCAKYDKPCWVNNQWVACKRFK